MKKMLLILLVAFTCALLVLFAKYSNKPKIPEVFPMDKTSVQPTTSEKSDVSKELVDFAGSDDVRLYPIDEASQNKDFEKFRTDFLVAIQKKNLDYVKSHIDETIKYSFGENDKVGGFLKQWGLDTNPEKSEFWLEMKQVLTHGGTFNDSEKTTFTAPYVFTSFPEKYDAFFYDAVINNNAKVYTDADINSKVLGKLTYSIVKVINRNVKEVVIDGQNLTWMQIVTISGKQGFMLSNDLRSPIYYRASFKNIDGTWKLVFFVAGD